MSQRLLQIELNEFDPEFLREQSARLALTNTLKFLDFEQSESFTADTVEHQGLDPWVQWVNVHSGKPSAEHSIMRLGDTVSQTSKQIWEAVGDLGFNWSAWGVMNAPSGKLDRCDVFMPDPWSFDENTYPPRLQDLLAFPRYMARNYLHSDRYIVFKKLLRFARYYAPPSHWPIIMRFSYEVMKSTVTPGISLHSLTTLLDYLSTLEFLHYRKQRNSDYSLIFLNHLAHLQHQFWTTGTELHPEMAFGLRINNLIMGLLLDDCSVEDAVIIMNGMRQENVVGQGSYIYRQINPEVMLTELLGHQNFAVEQCMTNDAHLKFHNERDAYSAQQVLADAKLDRGDCLFYVERISDFHVFIQLSLERFVEEDELFMARNKHYKFYGLFELICERTGAHIQRGDAFSRNINLPSRLGNHEFYSHIVEFFRGKQLQAA